MARCGKKGRTNGTKWPARPRQHEPRLHRRTERTSSPLAHRPQRDAKRHVAHAARKRRSSLEPARTHVRSGHGPDARGAHPRGVVAPLEEVCFQPEAGSAICVQRFDDSLNSAIRTTYRISLRSSSLLMPRYPSTRVVYLVIRRAKLEGRRTRKSLQRSAEAGCGSRHDAMRASPRTSFQENESVHSVRVKER